MDPSAKSRAAERVIEGVRVTRHFAYQISSASVRLFERRLDDIADRWIDGFARTHLPCQVESVLVGIDRDHLRGAGSARDTDSETSNRPAAHDQHDVAGNFGAQNRVKRVAQRVHDRAGRGRDSVQCHDIECRHGQMRRLDLRR